MHGGAERRPWTSIPLAVGGIVVGHALAYALAYPIRAVRDARLEQTGHEGFPVLLLAGLLGSGMAVLWLGVRPIRGTTHSPSTRMLLGLQVPTFALLELAERGFDPAAVGDSAVALGIVIQVVLAFVIAGIARGAVAIGRCLARTAPGPAPAPRAVVFPRVADPATPDQIAFGFRRAPPVPSLV